MKKHNESLEQLILYVDNDLLDVLSDAQRDNIIAYATATIVTDERIKTRVEQQDAMLAAARREVPIIKDASNGKKGFMSTLKSFARKVLIYFIPAVIISLAIAAYVITKYP